MGEMPGFCDDGKLRTRDRLHELGDIRVGYEPILIALDDQGARFDAIEPGP